MKVHETPHLIMPWLTRKRDRSCCGRILLQKALKCLSWSVMGKHCSFVGDL